MQRRAFFNWRFVKRERRRSNKRWAVLLLFSIPAFVLCERGVISAGRVTDVSMLPTLMPGQYFLINKYILHLSKPRRGDIVILRPPEDSRWHYVKRVVGLEGETIAISGGRVMINGQALEEPYARKPTEPAMEPRRIPEDAYFLMGDNRPNSEDSRSFGPVGRNRIEGKIKPGRIFSFW